MSEIQDLQEEIRLLKEREASLQRQLMLERERRLHAEKIIENEKNACLELKSLLEQQDKKFRATIALPPSQFTNYFVRDSKLFHWNDSISHSYYACIHMLTCTYTHMNRQIHIIYCMQRVHKDVQKVHAHMRLCTLNYA